jgi:hypothetical protein
MAWHGTTRARAWGNVKPHRSQRRNAGHVVDLPAYTQRPSEKLHSAQRLARLGLRYSVSIKVRE